LKQCTGDTTTAGTKLSTERQAWRFAIWLVVITFTLQSFIAQIHIHDVATIIHETSSGSHGNAPADNVPMDCPFCQAVAHGSAFFLPTTVLFLIPAVWIELAAPILRLHATFAVAAHNWKSRAPPKA
jgi:hypothetical protein